MKIILQTVYDDVDQKFVDWYIKRLESNPEVSKQNISKDLKEKGSATLFTKMDKGTITTEYRIENDYKN